jgi:threonine/homoserine/homoserine lactone efflux protein
MAANSVLAFWALALLLIVVPGADWAFTLGAALHGRLVAPAVAGLVIGYAAMTLVVAAGVGAIVAGTPAALTALTLAGGSYLLWLGARTIATQRDPIPATEVSPVATGPGRRATVLRGIGVSGLNPKGLLIFIAVLPQFASPDDSWPLAVQISLLGLVFTVTIAVFYTVIGLFARTILRSRPRAGRAVGRVSGIGMIIIGTGLVIERLPFG